MTDRELLALAAKAAGLEIHGWYQDDEESFADINGDSEHVTQWNPLTDDGDALRLAIDLQISFWSDGLDVHVNAEKYTAQTADELYVTARRAIVRAAAEIGRAL